MENQISNIITILTALLTGGFLMLFIENQQITTYVIERLHQRMNPFFHSFTNYVKFVSSFESCYIWRKCTSSYMKCLKQYVKDISIYGGKAITSGQDFSIYSFSATELDSICNDRIFDFLTYMFPFYLKRALKQGLYKQYTTKNYNNINVKGAINISNHIKNNTPFTGKIAYRVKEYNCDNDLTQLIRHTIEYIRDSYMSSILQIDADTVAYVSQICNATPSYDKRALNNILIKNKNLISHPYYTEYRILQKLCIQILCHKRLKYGVDNNRIYGLLFSGSWLWEEFIYKTILNECGFSHPQNRAGKGGIYLFNKNEADINFVVSRCKRCPDYFKENFILDAKYKHLDNNRIDRNDMHQIISYMHVEKANIGGFIYPKSTMDIMVTKLGDLRGFGGVIYNIGVPIPQEKETYAMFSLEMTNIQEELKRKILDLS